MAVVRVAEEAEDPVPWDTRVPAEVPRRSEVTEVAAAAVAGDDDGDDEDAATERSAPEKSAS